MIMGWGEWCVPTLSDSQQFEIEKHKRIIHHMAATTPDHLAIVASDLARSNIMLQVIISNATRRIMELEVQEALAASPRRILRMHPIRRAWRWTLDQIARRTPWQQSAA